MNSLMTRPLLLRLVSVVAVAIGFYLPLAAVPMFADATGTSAAAGLANARAAARHGCRRARHAATGLAVGYRWALAAGLVLLGTPALVLLTPVGASVTAIVVVNAVRGIGFAIAVVAGGALTAALIPAERRGEGLALVGLVGGIPALLSLPFGTWAAAHWGYTVVFVLTAAVPFLRSRPCPGSRHAPLPSGAAHRVTDGLRNPALMRPGRDLRGIGLGGRSRRHLRAACRRLARRLGRADRLAAAAGRLDRWPAACRPAGRSPRPDPAARARRRLVGHRHGRHGGHRFGHRWSLPAPRCSGPASASCRTPPSP